MKKYSELFTLFCGYFNQDWEDDFDSTDAVIHAFAENGSEERIKDTIIELTLLIKEHHTITEWYNLMADDFGCCYALRSYGIDPYEWLKKIQNNLKRNLN